MRADHVIVYEKVPKLIIRELELLPDWHAAYKQFLKAHAQRLCNWLTIYELITEFEESDDIGGVLLVLYHECIRSQGARVDVVHRVFMKFNKMRRARDVKQLGVLR